ncbi:AAA family ATPase [Luteolibacter flavescens]|uniref:AAA family ATPase n=1 Tax=Luteolibacter flavescens TaxID=1859460 RepID=A0ABT3FLC2_9BACT|nr:AAA family ATPase [Luteolibacter flavescens]MCW1883984.1 AAA family ATPase [Luteolibacter flavescens]
MDTDDTSPRRGHKHRKYKIDRTDIAQWTKSLGEEQSALVFWLDDYARTQDLDLEELGKRLKKPDGKGTYSRDSVYQFLTGRRTSDQLDNMLAAIFDLRKIETERSKITRIGFVETDITRRIFQVCDSTRNFGKMGLVIGNTHVGKTTAFVEYTVRNNHGATTYVRMPAGGSKGAFLRALAPRVGVGLNHNDQSIANKIMAVFDERQLLIVDEFHQCLPRPTRKERNGVAPSVYHTVEWLRELHDETGLAIIYGVTPVFDAAMKNDFFSGIFKQTLQRTLITARLPDSPTKKSLAAFAKHFGLEPATGEALDLQTLVLREDSLGRWISILEGASKVASRHSAPLAWDHVIQSHAALVRLENGD